MATDLETLATLLELPDAAGAKASIVAIASAAGLDTSSFTLGEPTERFLEIAGRAMDAWGSVPTAAVRGMFLGLATDPGDAGDLSADQTPRAGFLSALGLGWFGVERAGQLYATGFVTITAGAAGLTAFPPFALTVERNFTGADGGTATYRNADDASIYTGLGGTLTLAPGATAIIPITADQIGTYANATPGTITIAVTSSYGTFTVTNVGAVLGREREAKADYIARCMLAATKLANGGPQKAYLFAMNTAKDGSPLQRFDGSGVVGITRAYVSPESATNEVTIYFADSDGPALTVDVSSANANIAGTLLADPVTGEFHNAVPMGVVPDTVTLLPTVADPNTGGPGGAAAISTAIAITYSVRALASSIPGGASPGTYTTAGSNPDPVDDTFAAILESLTAFIAAAPIGGLEQVAGAGVLYRSDIQDAIHDAQAGLYGASVTLPATSTVALLLGHVATLGAITGSLVLV